MKKKDYVYLSITIVLYLILTVVFTSNTFYYGSSLDWYSQHVSIPEYFRTLFYDTKELIPSFAMNIGAGQNIFNFSYYGLLSPVILVSYLLPFISMVDYIILSSILLSISSTILLYNFLKKHKFSAETSFASVTLFILSSSISFHSHRHIMFVSYMLFLILGLFGVDKKVDHKKSSLLIISVFLMIMTSYYFSISGILVLVLYYLYRTKSIKSVINIILPIVVAILMSAVILIPTAYTLLNNRMDSNISISIFDLLVPYPSNISNLVIGSYGIGLTFIAFISLIHLFFKDKKVSLILISIIMFDIFNYILNGFIYINSKTLIPFLPLYIYAIAIFIEDIFKKKIDLKKILMYSIPFILYFLLNKVGVVILIESIIIFISLYYFNKTKNNKIIIIPIIVFSFIISYIVNDQDFLEQKILLKHDNVHIAYLLNDIKDKDFYRTNINYRSSTYPNKNFGNINYYNATSYSSVDNTLYNKFYYDRLTNEMPYRNRSLVVSSNNLLSNMLLSNKYIISREKAPLFYEEVKYKDFYLYKNDNVLPIAFHNSNLITYGDFEKLNKYEQQLGFLKLIVNDKVTNNNYQNVIEKEKISLKDLFGIEGDKIEIDAEHGHTIKYNLNSKYKNKILFINFNLLEQNRDLAIKINGMVNKLTNKNWKYYNGNNSFTYTLSIKDEEYLTMIFDKGKYVINNLEVYSLDVKYIENIRNSVTPLNITNQRGNEINGNINTPEDGYLMFTIPYDKGFKAFVDGKEVQVEKLDYSFIGFPLNKGRHIVTLEYTAPYLNISKYLSLIGISAFLLIIYYEKNTKKKYKDC